MNDITAPLRLAVGSHEAGSGKGCAMNLISWENGDTTITDFPSCSDPVLARIVQSVNDTICEHRDGDLLCSPCSLEVLALGHRTVGTGFLRAQAGVARLVWLPIADDQVAHARKAAPGDKWLPHAENRLADAYIDPHHVEPLASSAIYFAGLAFAQTHGPHGKLRLAHRAIDLFEQLTVDYRVEVTREISATDVEQAYACMTA